MLPPTSVNPNWRIGIVYSPYYKEEAEAIVRGTEEALSAAGIKEENISKHVVFGSFEIPLIGAALCEAKKVDALVGIGIIVEGETQHARLLADQTAKGMMDIQVRYRVPFAFEVLYVNNLAQAKERSAKGAEAAAAVLHSLAKLAELSS